AAKRPDRLLPDPRTWWRYRGRRTGRDRVRPPQRPILGPRDGSASQPRPLLGRASPAFHRAVRELRNRARRAGTARCVPAGDPQPVTSAEAALRPHERVPGQLQYRPGRKRLPLDVVGRAGQGDPQPVTHPISSRPSGIRFIHGERAVLTVDPPLVTNGAYND